VNPVTYIDTEAREAAVTNDAQEEAKRVKRQRIRSLAIAVGLGFLVLVFYAATIVRMGGHQAGEFAPGAQAPGQGTAPANGGGP